MSDVDTPHFRNLFAYLLEAQIKNPIHLDYRNNNSNEDPVGVEGIEQWDLMYKVSLLFVYL